MGELVNLTEWKEKKQEEEDLALKEELDRLQAEVKELIADMDRMGPHTGPIEYPAEDDLVPNLYRVDRALDGYWDAWLGLKDKDNVEGDRNYYSDWDAGDPLVMYPLDDETDTDV
jgi:hypothetical protein|tara:strand:+ start:90 stop:434 length:345 start_codon:yes stop_codon:yes gene_type:complete